jgi:glucosamine-6-phosphate deaminase
MDLDWSRVTTFNLDEYIGLPREHPQSYHSFMWENLFRTSTSTRKTSTSPMATRRTSRLLRGLRERIREAGGIDLQVLGIGTDGHIGFNEPSSSLASRTRIKTLTRRRAATTRASSAARTPCRTMSSPWASAPSWRRARISCSPSAKTRPGHRRCRRGPITAINPASVLQMHPVVKVCLDEPAARD